MNNYNSEHIESLFHWPLDNILFALQYWRSVQKIVFFCILKFMVSIATHILFVFCSAQHYLKTFVAGKQTKNRSNGWWITPSRQRLKHVCHAATWHTWHLAWQLLLRNYRSRLVRHLPHDASTKRNVYCGNSVRPTVCHTGHCITTYPTTLYIPTLLPFTIAATSVYFSINTLGRT